MDRTRVLALAGSLGLSRAGIARLRTLPDGAALRQFVAEGRHGTMAWMERGAERRADTAVGFPWARSVVVAALNYAPAEEPPHPAGTGRVARYARGEDYHAVLGGKLEQLAEALRAGGVEARAVVDTAPIMEKPWARESGVAWIGKNTNAIDPRLGSWFCLGAVLVAADLEPDLPAPDHCGSCTLCLDACPTQALTEPYRIDGSRCISYLTIEHRGPVDPGLRKGLGGWVFGCDICQEVCPWNREAPPATEPGFAPKPGLSAPSLGEWIGLQEEAYRLLTRGTAVRRAKRGMLRRNAALAAGNTGDRSSIPALKLAAQDADPMIAEAAMWALRKLEEP